MVKQVVKKGVSRDYDTRPGKRLHNELVKSPCFMGNLTISMAMFDNPIVTIQWCMEGAVSSERAWGLQKFPNIFLLNNGELFEDLRTEFPKPSNSRTFITKEWDSGDTGSKLAWCNKTLVLTT